MAGYSGTPLPRKLGLKPGQRVRIINPPDGFDSLLGPLPPGAVLLPPGAAPIDLAVLFRAQGEGLPEEVDEVTRLLAPDGALWIAWPKRKSGVPTDLTEDSIRAIALARTLVDVKVCAIDDTWSGLKLVIRKSARSPTPAIIPE